jgi:hypothetical protein
MLESMKSIVDNLENETGENDCKPEVLRTKTRGRDAFNFKVLIILS